MELTEGKEYWIKAKFLGELSKSANDEPYIPERRYAFRVGIRETSVDFSLVGFEAIEALPEREKVVIPKFVADYIEESKKEGRPLGIAMWESFAPLEVRCWMYDSGKKNITRQELFARAWFDGYDIEKEQLYWVRDKNGYAMLYLSPKGSITTVNYDVNYEEQIAKKERYTLTEKQIKDYDERYWAFAVSVEEEE